MKSCSLTCVNTKGHWEGHETHLAVTLNRLEVVHNGNAQTCTAAMHSVAMRARMDAAWAGGQGVHTHAVCFSNLH
jgi:hypothetical protein